jgi:hypothetical protein
MSLNPNEMNELYRYYCTNELRTRYMLPASAGERIGIKVRSLVGLFSETFVNINVTTRLGYAGSIKVLVYWCVVTLPICLATVNNMIYRFREPPQEKVELRIGEGIPYAGSGVSGFCVCPCN